MKIVRLILFILICSQVFLSSAQLDGAIVSKTSGVLPECKQFVPCEKTYVSKDQIHLDDAGIFVVFQDVAIRTSAIYYDQQGIYFKDCHGCDDNEWWCSICDICVKIWYWRCTKCLTSR